MEDQIENTVFVKLDRRIGPGFVFETSPLAIDKSAEPRRAAQGRWETEATTGSNWLSNCSTAGQPLSRAVALDTST